MRRLIFPLILGVFGCAVLIGLGTWQMQRLQWKEALLSDITSRIGAEPVALPEAPEPEVDRFRPVEVDGRIDGDPLRVLVTAEQGAGYRLVAPFATGGGRILVDLGFVPQQSEWELPDDTVAVTGNLQWPRETDSWTPAPEGDLWFGREVEPMAEALGTLPVMVIARTYEGADLPTTPMPVTTAGIPNDHLEYAITWFGLALVWAIMSGYLVWRVIRRKDA